MSLKDGIHIKVKQAFQDKGLDINDFEKDLTAFDDTGKRAVVIFDSGQSPYQYIVLGMKRVDTFWDVVGFKQPLSYYDGVDAMCDANSFLQGFDKL
ncbi:MAG: hypothetical protein J7L15_08400 [Clostridiales bacterium]|nr:hypothetical protein [Clostridiales bacterium]